MAKPGDVVEFRSGLHGIKAPRNLGILLDRWRKKGTAWARLVTVDGVKELKAEHLSKRAFRDRYPGDLKDTAGVQARLHDLLQRHTEGALAEEAEDDLGRLEETLWEATSDQDRTWTDTEIAAAHYGDPSPQQVKDVRAALDRCRRPGTGRFEVQDKGDQWRPWTRDEVERMRAAWQALQDLRKRLVRKQETDEGPAFVRVPLEEAGLTDEDRTTLEWARAAMVQFIEHDGVPDHGPVHGIGGLGAVQVFGMDLHRVLGFLAMDWIQSEPTSRSSDYVHFLLEAGLWGPQDAVDGLMRRHVNQEPFFEHTPDPDAEAAAEALDEPTDADLGDREDLRHLECYTIDPADAKDFDDAVGIETTSDGTTRLWIHIADVGHYVRIDGRLDRHAKTRATSVYLPGRVLPMLPARIADHLCSLRDDGDRYALSVALDVDRDGHVTDASFHKSLIRVDENLHYGQALERAEAGREPFASLLALAERMRGQRKGLDLETGELKVLLEKSGFSALEKRADRATRMIETFMVAANIAVASRLAEAKVPLLYRCHPLPDASKAERFRHQLATMGFDVPFELPESAKTPTGSQSLLDQLKAGGGKMELFGGGLSAPGDDPGAGPDGDGAEPDGDGTDLDHGDEDDDMGFARLPEEEREAWLEPFRTVVDALAAHPDDGLADVATFKLLACMGRAYYSPTNEGHFGLAATHYCHFTSPIRRYPDLVVHRNLKWLLAGGDGDPPHPAQRLETLCDHCSDQERAAAGLERRIGSAGLVLASLAGDPSGSARITGITPGGVFVRRGDGIEARCPARDLPGGPFHVDEWESMLFLSDVEAPQRFDPEDLEALQEWYDEELGESRRVRARLGDKVQIALAGRDVADGRTSARVRAWHGGPG